MAEVNVEPHDKYTKGARGKQALDQFLHTDYVVVGIKHGRTASLTGTKHAHVLAMQVGTAYLYNFADRL